MWISEHQFSDAFNIGLKIDSNQRYKVLGIFKKGSI